MNQLPLEAQEATPIPSPTATTQEVPSQSVAPTPISLASPLTESTNVNALQDLASQAASEKLQQVSASIVRTQLQKESDPAKRKVLALHLSEILVNEQKSEEALVLLDSKDLSPENSPPDEMVLFWKAEALLALERASEARSCLQKILSSKTLPQKYSDAARIGLARADRALGDFEQAIALLDQMPVDSTLTSVALQERCADLLKLQRHDEVEQLLKNNTLEQFSQQPRLAYLFALAAWQRGDQAESLKRFNFISDEHITDRWVPAAVVSGIAAADLTKPVKSQSLLEKYLQDNPQSPRLPELMNQLEQVYLLQNNNDVTLFRKWSKDTTQPLHASYAMLPYARMMERLGHRDKASQLLSSFLSSFPNHPLVNEAHLELAENKLLQGDATGALLDVVDRPSLSPKLRARYAFLRGLIESALKNPEAAEQSFAQAVTLDEHLSADATYNESLLALFSSKDDDHKKDFSSNDMMEKIAVSNGMKEREEYLAVLNADQGDRKSATAVIKLARDFLTAHPQSPFVNQVRMKLGESLLVNSNARDALIELEKVGNAEPNSELGRQALLLAAQASARSMDSKSIDDAVMILEQVAQNPNAGGDRWQARFEQAALKNAQAQPLEAISIYNQILASPEPGKELRAATQMAKGDTLSGTAEAEPANNQKALAVWRELASEQAMPAHWRNQALCKIGLISEKMGDTDAALAAYYEAMKTPLDQEPEQLWHDKAAFEAARLLETKQEWSDASRIYQQIISEAGPRAAEAKARLSKLRLENFLWEN
ncbi:MAG: hypothetical protein ACH346_03600 [Chthoniobacterales bacterium]